MLLYIYDMTHVKTTAKLTHLNITPTPPIISVFQIYVVNDLKSCFLYVRHTQNKQLFKSVKTIVVVSAFLPITPKINI